MDKQVFRLNFWQKAILWMLFLIDIGRLLYSLATSQPVGLFVILGIIPGSGRVASYDGVIHGCVVAFTAASLLIFSTNIYRMFKWVFNKNYRRGIAPGTLPDNRLVAVGPTHPTDSSLVQPEKNEPDVLIHRQSYPWVAEGHFARDSFKPASRLAPIPAALSLSLPRPKGKIVSSLLIRTVTYLLRGLEIGIQIVSFLVSYTALGTQRLTVQIKRLWRFSEPYLRQYDRKIEVRLRRALALPIRPRA